jgi:hypothetical protein
MKLTKLNPPPFIIFLIITLFSQAFFIFMTILYSYFGKNYTEKISWVVADGAPFFPSGIFGLHTFGDFLVPYLDAKADDLWASKNLYPPLAMLYFKLFTFLPNIGLGLAVYMFILLSSSILFIIHILRKINLEPEKKLIFFFILITSAPFIALVDRGNVYFLIPFLLYFSLYYLDKGEIYPAALFFGIIISLKTYPVFLLILFFSAPRFILWSIISSLSLTLVSLLSLRQPIGNFVFTYLDNLLQGPTQTLKVPQNSSFISMVNHLLSCFQIDLKSSSVYSISLTFVLMMFLVVLVKYMKKEYRFIVILFATQLVLPNSFYYNKLWVIPFIAIFFSRQTQKSFSQLKNSSSVLKLTYAFIAITLSSFTWPGSSLNLTVFFQFIIFLLLCHSLRESKVSG